jgi:2-polyprenyl-6-methoxyphenol hydroxylase-like FAD-dependent oxidoreductase
MTEILRQADLETLRCWTCYELPVGCKWEHKKGFTLIGDASSLTAPFSAEGVNKAMKDALELAKLIGKSQDPNNELTLDQAVLEYEHLMFPRAGKLQVATMSNKQIMFISDTPATLISGMVKIKASESSSIFMKIGTRPLVALAYCYFWIRIQIGWAVRRLWRRT